MSERERTEGVREEIVESASPADGLPAADAAPPRDLVRAELLPGQLPLFEMPSRLEPATACRAAAGLASTSRCAPCAITSVPRQTGSRAEDGVPAQDSSENQSAAAPPRPQAAPPRSGDALEEALRRHFGHIAFRPGQRQVIESILAGRPTLAVMPTGSGKSLCFQLPALLLPGVTLVVSPLIALMKDQVDALEARRLPATFVNSTLSERERRDRAEAMASGRFRIVYLAPERFRSPLFLELLGRTHVSLLAVDEAHCISQWGHDFRPDYLKLGEVRGQLRGAGVLALTATATPFVRQDIVKALHLERPAVFVTGFDRPNLFLEVRAVDGAAEKLEYVTALASRGGSGIVYAATRRSAEQMHLSLLARGVPALCYHAGHTESRRRATQEAFMGSDRSVVVATNAFGMGIDKADVRFVAHAEIPGSLEAYYQEIGRAGRDGAEASAVLLFNHADVHRQRRIVELYQPTELLVRDLWELLRRTPTLEASTAQLAARVGAREGQVAGALRLLEHAGHLERGSPNAGTPSNDLAPPRFTLRVIEPALSAARLRIDFIALKQRRLRELALLQHMTRYAYAHGCRRRFLLDYFGERTALQCGRCERCRGSLFLKPPPLALLPLRGIGRRQPGAESRRRTLELFVAGLPVEAVATRRGLSEETIRGHLADLIEAGVPLEIERIVPRERAEQIIEAARRAPADLQAIKRLLPPDFLFGEIRVLLAERTARSRAVAGGERR